MLKFIVTAFAWGTYALPHRWQRRFAKMFSRILIARKWRLQIVEKNLGIARAYGVGERTSLRDCYVSFVLLVLELLWLFGPLKRLIWKSVKVKGSERISEALAQGRKVILLSSHVGNWEVMSGTAAREGFRLMIVTKRLKPAWLHEWIQEARLRIGYAATYEPRTMKDLKKHFESGGVVGFVLDQYAGNPVGVRVPFLGVPVGTAAIVATLAVRYDAAVLPVVCARQKDGSFDLTVESEITGNFAQGRLGIAERTAAYTKRLEEHIRSFPEQWLWTHQRFKGDLSPLRRDEWIQARVRRGE